MTAQSRLAWHWCQGNFRDACAATLPGQRPLGTRQGDDIESYPLPFLPDFLCVKSIHGQPGGLQDLDGFLDQGCFANP